MNRVWVDFREGDVVVHTEPVAVYLDDEGQIQPVKRITWKGFGGPEVRTIKDLRVSIRAWNGRLMSHLPGSLGEDSSKNGDLTLLTDGKEGLILIAPNEDDET